MIKNKRPHVRVVVRSRLPDHNLLILPFPRLRPRGRDWRAAGYGAGRTRRAHRTAGLPRVGTCLHQPSRRRVAQHMRRHVRAETRIFHQRGIITGEFRSA
jgi:hypothetical protein